MVVPKSEKRKSGETPKYKKKDRITVKDLLEATLRKKKKTAPEKEKVSRRGGTEKKTGAGVSFAPFGGEDQRRVQQ